MTIDFSIDRLFNVGNGRNCNEAPVRVWQGRVPNGSSLAAGCRSAAHNVRVSEILNSKIGVACLSHKNLTNSDKTHLFYLVVMVLQHFFSFTNLFPHRKYNAERLLFARSGKVSKAYAWMTIQNWDPIKGPCPDSRRPSSTHYIFFLTNFLTIDSRLAHFVGSPAVPGLSALLVPLLTLAKPPSGSRLQVATVLPLSHAKHSCSLTCILPIYFSSDVGTSAQCRNTLSEGI